MSILLALSSSQNALQALAEDPPADPASVFVLLLSIGVIGGVVWFGRSPKDPS